MPSRLPLAEDDIQVWLDRRRPGQSRFTTQRQEPDRVEILSGVFEGVTTGTPVSLLIRNTDQRSKDYGEIKDNFRPGHADSPTDAKYGLRDYRGGGRAWRARPPAASPPAPSPARSWATACESAATLVQMGPHRDRPRRASTAPRSTQPVLVPGRRGGRPLGGAAPRGVRKEGSSVGAVIEVVASGVPAGWGEPVYDKLDADIAKALMRINAVKGVEIGAGFASAALRGEDNADEMRVARRPPPLPLQPRRRHPGRHLDRPGRRRPLRRQADLLDPDARGAPSTADGSETEIVTKGRHDPCVGIRAVPVGEAMLACVLADHMLRHKGVYGG